MVYKPGEGFRAIKSTIDILFPEIINMKETTNELTSGNIINCVYYGSLLLKLQQSEDLSRSILKTIYENLKNKQLIPLAEDIFLKDLQNSQISSNGMDLAYYIYYPGKQQTNINGQIIREESLNFYDIVSVKFQDKK